VTLSPRSFPFWNLPVLGERSDRDGVGLEKTPLRDIGHEAIGAPPSEQSGRDAVAKVFVRRSDGLGSQIVVRVT
jgi:hypothetical protein